MSRDIRVLASWSSPPSGSCTWFVRSVLKFARRLVIIVMIPSWCTTRNLRLIKFCFLSEMSHDPRSAIFGTFISNFTTNAITAMQLRDIQERTLNNSFSKLLPFRNYLLSWQKEVWCLFLISWPGSRGIRNIGIVVMVILIGFMNNVLRTDW